MQEQIKESIKIRVTGLCAWNSPVTGEFPAQMASIAENVSIWWRHRRYLTLKLSRCTNYYVKLYRTIARLRYNETV